MKVFSAYIQGRYFQCVASDADTAGIYLSEQAKASGLERGNATEVQAVSHQPIQRAVSEEWS